MAVKWKIYCVVILAMALPELALAQPNIGAAGGVVNDVRGTIGGNVFDLAVGDEVFQNEIVETGAESATQLIFLDETALSMGPESRVLLDELVYNPDQSLSRAVLEFSVGVARFIPGDSDPAVYIIRTPVALIGVRGTIFDLYVDAITGTTTVLLIEGTAEVRSLEGPSVTLDRPGLATTIGAVDAVPTEPAPPTQQLITLFSQASPSAMIEAATEEEETLTASIETEVTDPPISIQQIVEFTDDLGACRATHGTHGC